MLLEAQNVVKTFGGLVAVNGVSVQVNPGEILGLIGPNGAGKTTFLNCLAGSLKPTSGKVIFNDEETTGDSPEKMCRKGMARTFQIPRPFPKMTVLENVSVGAVFGAKHSDPGSSRKRAEAALELTEFPMDYEMLASALNTCSLKRLDLARALSCGPKLLLLDELASGLTPSELDSMIALILQIRNRFNVGIIVVEHIMKLITGICDRLLVIQYGSPIAEGTPAEVMTNTKVIEAYLGTQD